MCDRFKAICNYYSNNDHPWNKGDLSFGERFLNNINTILGGKISII